MQGDLALGETVHARCTCGYALSLSIGRGLMPAPECFPARCVSCRDVVSVELGGDSTCPGCGGPVTFYDDASLLADAGTVEVASWDGHVLTDGRYVCARCDKPELEFFRVEDWD